MLKPQSITLFTSCIVLLASCSGQKENTESQREPVRVETVTVSGTGLQSSRTYSGTLQEGEASNISFSAAGTIKQLRVKPGDHVSQGQIIGTLDDSSLQNAFEIANATLAQAQDAYDRMKILHDANSLPEIKWVDVQQKLVQAKNAADIARNALNDAVLRAPFSGMVAEKPADVGQLAVPGVPVVRLVKINPLKAVISIPQTEIASFREGQTASIAINDGSDTVVEGLLTEKGVAANPLSRAYDVKFTISNQSGALLPGMICNVTVEGATVKDAIVLPQSVVMLDEHNNNFVWLDSAGTARKRIVTVNALRAEGLEVTQGLLPGDKVIVKGQQKVCNGTKVQSIN